MDRGGSLGRAGASETFQIFGWSQCIGEAICSRREDSLGAVINDVSSLMSLRDALMTTPHSTLDTRRGEELEFQDWARAAHLVGEVLTPRMQGHREYLIQTLPTTGPSFLFPKDFLEELLSKLLGSLSQASL